MHCGRSSKRGGRHWNGITIIGTFPMRTNWANDIQLMGYGYDLQPGQSITVSAQVRTGNNNQGTFSLLFAEEL